MRLLRWDRRHASREARTGDMRCGRDDHAGTIAGTVVLRRLRLLGLGTSLVSAARRWSHSDILAATERTSAHVAARDLSEDAGSVELGGAVEGYHAKQRGVGHLEDKHG